MPPLRFGCVFFCAISAFAAEKPPEWAFVVAPPGPLAAQSAPQPEVRHVPDSSVEFKAGQLIARQGPVPDWHADEHPPMPDIVGNGREPKVWACAYCHLPSGAGRPENASLAGLSAAYIEQQVRGFRDKSRQSAVPAHGPTLNMVHVAEAATEAEVKEAAAYFASLPRQSFVSVVECESAPRVYIAGAHLAKHPDGGTEALAGRILEVPDEVARFDNRDSRTSYTAYVPVGSLERGRLLCATGGEGKTIMCAACHGPTLQGGADAPRLAGRSPSYLMRQLVDFKTGARNPPNPSMRPVVAGLSQADMTAIVAYLASLKP